MLYSKFFYNGVIKKYVVGFGSLFRNIYVVRKNKAGEEVEREIVPITYANKEKFVQRIEQDYSVDQRVAIKLPRMSFEIVGYTYDTTRKLSSKRKISSANSETGADYTYNPVPYDIDFNLNIATKTQEEGLQIVEQIIPFFTPDYTLSMRLIDADDWQDIPVTLVSVSSDDSYEGVLDERRLITWTLSFRLKGYLYGPTRRVGKVLTTISSMINTFDFPTEEQVNETYATRGFLITNTFDGLGDETPERTFYFEDGNNKNNFSISKGLTSSIRLSILDGSSPFDFSRGVVSGSYRESYSSNILMPLEVSVVEAGLVEITIPSETSIELNAQAYPYSVSFTKDGIETILVEAFFAVIPQE